MNNIINFPKTISLTITNKCNLKCQMCGQWSTQGYMHHKKETLKQELDLADWKKIIDELSANHIASLLIRGGEPFLFPNIMDLLEYINQKNIFISIDTNGTLLKKYATDIVRLGNIHLTISIDGPEKIHDRVRGVKGCFKKIKENIDFLNEIEKNRGSKISKGITFTISPYSLKGLGEMPDIARTLSIDTIVIAPYCYISKALGKTYERELKEQFNCTAFSWIGFHHENSEVDFKEFQKQYNTFKTKLGNLYNYPYMVLTEDEYQKWFKDGSTPVGPFQCSNIEKLIDIQPTGEANFCVDLPDLTIGNVTESTIKDIWNGKKATMFREYRRRKRLSACNRCVAKYMSVIHD